MMQKLILIFLVLSLGLSAVPSEKAQSVVKPEVYFYSGLALVVYSFVVPVRYEKLKTVIDPFTGEEEEKMIQYGHPRWPELALGLVLHQIGSNFMVANNSLTYKVEF